MKTLMPAHSRQTATFTQKDNISVPVSDLCQIKMLDLTESCLHTLHPTAAKGRDGAQPKTQWAFHSEEGKDIPFGSARLDVASVGHVTQVE